MKVQIFNNKKEKKGLTEFSEAVFAAKWNPDLVHQVYVSELANARVNLAHTKGRSEVRGGGKKPWAQKHTGRARASSIRSSIWIGGGVALGPRNERNFKKKINKKMRKSALYSLLSKKMAEGEVFILDSFGVKNGKTKEMAAVLRSFFSTARPSVLCVVAKDNGSAIRAGRNLPRVKMAAANHWSLVDALKYKNILMEEAVAAALK